MNRKNLKKFLLALPVFIAALIMYALISAGDNVSAEDKPIHDPQRLKSAMNISIKDIPSDVDKKCKISKKEAIEIANKVINTNGHSVKICVQRNLMTDPGITMNAISDKAKKANKELSSKENFENIPVWIVSFEGLPTTLRNGVTLNELNVVIDAVSGEFLYSFNYR